MPYQLGIGAIPVTVADNVHSPVQQRLDRVVFQAAPLKAHFGTGVCEPDAQGEGVYGAYRTHYRITRHVAYPVFPSHRTGYGSGDVLALVDPAVIAPHSRVGEGEGAVVNGHVLMLRGDPAAGVDQVGSGGEYHVRPVGNGLLHAAQSIAPGQVTAHGEIRVGALPQVVFALLVGGRPGAGGGVEIVYERRVQFARPEYALDQAFFTGLGFGAEGDGAALGQQADVRPNGRKRPAQILVGHVVHLRERMHFQIREQGIGGGQGQFFGVQALKLGGKTHVFPGKLPPEFLIPYLPGFEAQGGLQAGVTARNGEGDGV